VKASELQEIQALVRFKQQENSDIPYNFSKNKEIDQRDRSTKNSYRHQAYFPNILANELGFLAEFFRFCRSFETRST